MNNKTIVKLTALFAGYFFVATVIALSVVGTARADYYQDQQLQIQRQMLQMEQQRQQYYSPDNYTVYQQYGQTQVITGYAVPNSVEGGLSNALGNLSRQLNQIQDDE